MGVQGGRFFRTFWHAGAVCARASALTGAPEIGHSVDLSGDSSIVASAHRRHCPMDGATEKNAHIATERWEADASEIGREFYTFPPLVAFHSKAITGRPLPYSSTWLEDWICDTCLPPSVERLVSLSCGFGELERILARRGLFRECVAYDISPRPIERAQRGAAEAGLTNIRYEQANLNRVMLEPRSADVVWANGALHHIENLSHAVAEIHRALKHGGTLVAVEFVGANHQRPTARQYELINAIIHLIPPRLRATGRIPASLSRYPALLLARVAMLQFLGGRLGAPQSPAGKRTDVMKRILYAAGAGSARLLPPDRFKFGAAWKYDRRYFTKVDPSEGVCASDVIPAVRARFPDADVRYFHGSLLAYALDGVFYEKFDPESAADRELLRSLVEFERQAIERGEVVSENAVIIARKSG